MDSRYFTDIRNDVLDNDNLSLGAKGLYCLICYDLTVSLRKLLLNPDTKAQTIEITLVNEDGSEIAKVTGILNTMKAGESTQLNIATTSDYVNAYDFKVAIK